MAQERERLERAARAEGFEGRSLDAAMAWVDERARLVVSDVPIADVLAVQQSRAREPWHPTTLYPYDDEPSLRFLRGMLDFDPETVLPHVHCPVLVLLGAADDVAPARASAAAYARLLPDDPRSGIAVLPGADHSLRVAVADDDARGGDLAAGYVALVAGFLASQRR